MSNKQQQHLRPSTKLQKLKAAKWNLIPTLWLTKNTPFFSAREFHPLLLHQRSALKKKKSEDKLQNK